MAGQPHPLSLQTDDGKLISKRTESGFSLSVLFWIALLDAAFAEIMIAGGNLPGEILLRGGNQLDSYGRSF